MRWESNCVGVRVELVSSVYITLMAFWEVGRGGARLPPFNIYPSTRDPPPTSEPVLVNV